MNSFERQIKDALFAQLPGAEITLEVPPDQNMGNYSFPCFIYAKLHKKNPADIAKKLSQSIHLNFIEKIETKGGYLNFFIRNSELSKSTLALIFSQKSNYGCSTEGTGKTLVIDSSSPNIAKPFGIGHLRSTIIGNSIGLIYSCLGWKVIKVNHLGDWGTQFGKLIYAYKQWGEPKKLESEPIKHLLDLYIKFHEEAEKNPALEDEGRAWFKKLEDGNKEAELLWNKFRELSLREFNEVYSLLNVSFDSYAGEASYNDLLEPTIQMFSDKGLAIESDGALVVDLSEFKMPPLLLRKQDGATLYATRDLAAAIYRFSTYRFDKMIYEVGQEQKLHFQQLFATLKKAGLTWADSCEHVYHGLYLDSDRKKFATRKGKVLFLREIIDETVAKVRATIEEKNPALANKEEVAKKVAIGAILFGDLANDRTRDVVFDIDRFLDFEGETGPYIQYAHVRCCSIISKAGHSISADVDFSKLVHPSESTLITLLARFPQDIKEAATHSKPNIIANSTLKIAQAFNEFYHSCKVNVPEEELQKARLCLVDCTRIVLEKGLYLLGIEAPNEM